MRLSYFKTKRAFTLAELFVVIGILIIIAVPILLSYHSYMQKKNLELSAQEVQSALYEARDMSLAPTISQDEEVYGFGIHFARDSNSYFFFKDLDEDYSFNGRPAEVLALSSKTYKLRGDVQFLDFNPNASNNTICDVVFGIPAADPLNPYSKKTYFNSKSTDTGIIKLGYESGQKSTIKIDLATNVISIEGGQ